MLFLYKYLDISDYDLMVNEIKNYLNLDYLRNVDMVFIQYNPEEILSNCKLLAYYAKENNLNVIKTVIVRAMPRFHKMNIHVDNCNAKTFEQLKVSYIHDFSIQTRDYLGLQIGLENVEDTKTSFFEYVSGDILKTNYIRSTNRATENYPAMRFEHCEMREIGHYIATRPVLFNATVPHTVVNNTDRVRLLLSLRFNPDPWHLTE